MEQWIKAGKIGAEILSYAKTKAKPGISLLELAQLIEKKTADLKAKPAFPINLSLNHMAAHYTPLKDDKLILKEEDILKIDLGVHIGGYISDTALTIGPNKELIKASEEALKEAIKFACPGIELRKIGAVVQNVISSYNFAPIKNLSGHQIKQYDLHAGLTIPNYDNGNTTKLEEGMIIAIEPFATTGKGKITEGKPASIYRFIQNKPVRDATTKKILNYIEKEYSTLPFAKRWLQEKFPTANFALRNLENQGAIKQYTQLPEESKGLVSQAEHTILVKDKPIVLTRRD
ncbi:MAG: type II methionyl aminopeptidase [archaeon]